MDEAGSGVLTGSAKAASRGNASGEGGSNGDCGGDLHAPSSWGMLALSPGVDSFLLLLALVLLGEVAGLLQPLDVAATTAAAAASALALGAGPSAPGAAALRCELVLEM